MDLIISLQNPVSIEFLQIFFFGKKNPAGTFEQFIFIGVFFKLVLETAADTADTFIQMLDDMEHVNADAGIGKHFFCH